MQKRKILISLLAVIVVAAALLFTYYWKYFRGAWPAFSAPKPAVTVESPSAPQDPTNTTGIPLTMPKGFSASIYAKNLGDPRVMIWGPEGAMLVSIPGQGKVVALLDTKNKGVADQTVTVADHLNGPHGLATKCNGDACKLYVAEMDKVTVFDYDKTTHKALNGKKLVDIPSGGRHVTRTIMFLPAPNDNQMLISIGSDCDVCRETDARRAAIYIMNGDGSGFRQYAKGLRNSVFMALHPVTGKVWATDMGRDYLGDNLPPDEINIIEDGKNYGWPICYGKNIHDTQFDKNIYIRNPCMQPFETPSYIDIQAHSAPLGLAFFPKDGWPQEYWYNMLVAFHGSWNRTVPTGYKIERYKLDAQGKVLGNEDFITGWLPEGSSQAYGRPVDILIQPDDTIYVSDDKAGVIYKFSLKK